MNIIIAGCGKVGFTLAATLNDEGHDITMIDLNEEILEDTCNSLDVMGVVGNAASHTILMEAGIEEADLLIAVTNYDELNLLSCVMAKKSSHCNTIARVRNPIYSMESEFIKEAMGISLIINPELSTAGEITRLLRFPSATKIDTFAKGRVEIVQYEIEKGSCLDQLSLIDLKKNFSCDYLICAIERDEEVIIPSGQTKLQIGDTISILASPKHIGTLFKKIGAETEHVRDTMIIGGSTIGFYLSKNLVKMGIDVKIIERDRAKCEELSLALPKAVIIHGDATNQDLLLEEGIEHTESFVSLTNLDEENIMLALYAKSVSKAKLVTKVKRSIFDSVVDELDIGSVISPRTIMANHIIQYVRALQNTVGSNVETLYKIIDNKVEALEFQVKKESDLTNVKLIELDLRDNLLIGCINRNGQVIIPSGDDHIEVGDTVIVVTTNRGLNDIKDIMKA